MLARGECLRATRDCPGRVAAGRLGCGGRRAEPAASATISAHGAATTDGTAVRLRPAGLTGAEASEVLDKAAITVNKNAIPFDTESIMKTGGIRIGTPAMTTRGLKEDDMMQVADFIDSALKKRHDAGALAALRREVVSFTARFPLP